MAALAGSLKERGADLTILRGDPTQLVPRFAAAVSDSRYGWSPVAVLCRNTTSGVPAAMSTPCGT